MQPPINCEIVKIRNYWEVQSDSVQICLGQWNTRGKLAVRSCFVVDPAVHKTQHRFLHTLGR